MSTTEYSPMHTVKTTAAREIQVLAKSKGIIATVLILLLVVLGAIGFLTWQANKEDGGGEGSGAEVATVGVDKQLLDDAGLAPRDAADRAEAERLVRDGDVEAAVVAEGAAWEVLSDGLPSTSVMDTVSGLADAQNQAGALGALGISPQEYEAASPGISVEAVDISADAADGGESDFIRLMTAYVALLVIILTVITFAAQVGSRVTEEKSSRVVELVLASVRPLDFLAGKILGTLLLGFGATAVVLIAGALGLHFSGLLDGVEFDWAILPVMLGSWILAMLFFGALYAAAGAMVQRTEDLQSTQMPILVLIMISAYVPLFGWMNTDTTWMQAMSWIPPFSIFAAPLTYAAGNFTAMQLAASFTLALVATFLVVWFAARVYRRTILNNGRAVKWSEVLRK
ncbi:ABC transporter permease [Corynebacterium sp. BCW_4722]|nr:ABC transporter permease [Corynebacterium sp. BCW_4722]